QGGPPEDAGRADQAVGDAGRRAPCGAFARPARRRDQEASLSRSADLQVRAPMKGSETMVATKSTLAALALTAIASSAAQGQNGYSFLDAESSPVHYSVAPVKPAMTCANVASLASAETTVVSARVVPAADGVPE